MFTLNPKGRDWGLVVNWDDLGKTYAIIAVTWTVCLLSGTVWLIWHRNLSFIRIRNLPLAITSMVFLHVYLVKILLAYTTNGHFLCSAEYWIMCIYLPLGIALYQAYLSQLRSLWEQQQRLVLGSVPLTTRLSWWNPVARWKQLTRLRKSYCLIAVGLGIQLIVTTALYLATPTLQGDWSSYGKLPHAKGQGLCRKSLPWIPSAFWQLFWSWIYGPYTLYQVRHIRDIHMWKAQILISVIVGLPRTPLWLAALYEPKFKPLNIRFVPPMWLAPGIMVMQFVTIFFPIIEAAQAKKEMRRTLLVLQSHEKDSQASINGSQAGSSTEISRSSSYEKASTVRSSTERKLYTSVALRRALSLNPAPLLEFAATKEFSAENVLFLIRVRQWREQWSAYQHGLQDIQRLFAFARDIYITLISERSAEFPINIECKVRKQLDLIFEAAVPTALSMPPVFGKHPEAQVCEVVTMSPQHADGVEKWANRSTLITVGPLFASHPCIEPLGKAKAVIRPGFDEHVFDAAEKSVEYLVLTNTWQKFVRDKAASLDILDD